MTETNVWRGRRADGRQQPSADGSQKHPLANRRKRIGGAVMVPIASTTKNGLKKPNSSQNVNWPFDVLHVYSMDVATSCRSGYFYDTTL